MDTKSRPGEGATVLVVDDNPDVREILSRNLEREGYRVITASGGQECLDVVSCRPVDVILLDVMMPNMDGLTVCKELKKTAHGATIPVILVTAKDDVDTRAAGMRLGVSEYITKPVNMKELHTRLQSQLHAREIRRQLDDANRKLGKLTSDEAAT